MSSLIDIDAPGAYPATPSNEDPTQSTYGNKLYKQDVSGRGSDLEQNPQFDSRDFASSRSHADESALGLDASGLAVSHGNPVQQTPRTLGNDTQLGHHGVRDAGAGVADVPLSSESEGSKPGLMTGAYSLVEPRSSTVAHKGNYTYGPLTPVNTPADTTKPGLDVKPGLDSKTKSRDLAEGSAAQSGVHEQTKEQHKAPYWGDIPFGAGVYNGVTGHGSNESPTRQGSSPDTHERDVARHTGIYNGVTGHGSNEFEGHRMEGDSQTATLSDGFHVQGAPENVGNAGAAAATRPANQNNGGRDSHFEEALAGATAATTAATGYAAHKHHEKKEDGGRDALMTDMDLAHEKNLKGQGLGESNLPVRSLRHKDERIAGHTEQRQSRPMKLYAAAPAEKSAEREMPAKRADDVEDEKTSRDSNSGHYGAALAAAGAGAGAGVYGAHKYVERGNGIGNVEAPVHEGEKSSSSPSSAAAIGKPREFALAGTQLGREEKQSNMAPQDEPTAAGVSRSAEPHGEPTPRSGQQQHDGLLPDVSVGSGRRTGAHAAEAAEVFGSDPSRGGKYNVLSSGTPSGINLEQADTSKAHHGQGHSGWLSNASTH